MSIVHEKDHVSDNYKRVLERIDLTAAKFRRDRESIKLVVVTKKQSITLIQKVINAGAVYLGENYAEEALPKIKALRNSTQIKWHMIGHVQSRKAEIVSQNFDYVHSLDSLRLAERLDHYSEIAKRILPVLLQFNMSTDISKSGWAAWDDQQWMQLTPDVERILSLSHISVQGLMTIPPYFIDPEDTRIYFRKLRLLREFLALKFPQSEWTELSMGMSGDYEVAIQEGATWIRVGQAILGPRL